MIDRRRPGPWLAVLLAVCVGVPAAVASAQEDCAACHEDAVKSFGTSVHAVAVRGKNVSCSSCHGPGDAHVQSGGEGGIINPAKGKADVANANCLACHEGQPAHADWQGSPHQLAGVKCASCHDVHATRPGTPSASGRLDAVGESSRKCLECHGTVRAALNQRSSHPLKDGRVECVSCHRPHGSTSEKLVARASVNDLCYSCHQQLRGPFLWEHGPVREDCLTCHKAHGSNYPNLLQARTTQLCQSCHQQGRHQTLPGLPASMWVSNRACLNCHSQVHGSNHPSGPLFQR